MILTLKQDELGARGYEAVASHLRSSGIIVYPTETSYGIGANALNNEAVKKIYGIKGRDFSKPLPVIVKNLKMLISIAATNHREEDIISRFWPGPLTILFKARKSIENLAFIAGSNLVGARVSSHPFPAELFEHVDFPVTATSANISGEGEIDNFENVARLFSGINLGNHSEKIMLIDGGRLNGGTSTVIQVKKKGFSFVREGENNIKERLLCFIKNDK